MLFFISSKHPYDRFWESAVKYDERIKKYIEMEGEPHPITEEMYLVELICYRDTVYSLINNLKRQAHLFSDRDNIATYLEEIIKEASIDFEQYLNHLLPHFGRASICIKFIQIALDYLQNAYPSNTTEAAIHLTS